MKKSILLGCGEWGFRELPLRSHFEIAARFGFHYLEFGIGVGYAGVLSPSISAPEIREFKAYGEAADIRSLQCCIENDFTLADPEAHASMIEKAVREIRLAGRLGANQVRLFAGFTPAASMTEPLWEQMLDAFRVCENACQGLGIGIAIETHGKITMRDGAAHHEHTVSTDPASIDRLLRELPQSIGFNYDPGNLKAVEPGDTDLLLSRIGSRITYCHLKDWKRRQDGWEAVAIGDDTLDYASLLSRMDYDGVYLIEYEPVRDVEQGIARSIAYLNRIGVDIRFR